MELAVRGAAGWDAVARRSRARSRRRPPPTRPTIAKGAKGDLVVWAQEHLNGAGQTITVNGRYQAAMTAAVTA